MVKIDTSFNQPTTPDGTEINVTQRVAEDDARQFRLIAGGYYGVIIRSAKSKEYEAAWGKGDKAKLNPTNPNGKWQYHALTPIVEILNADTNEVNSLITRQDVTLGVLYQGRWYRPDGSTDSPFFKDGQNFLSSVGMFSKTGDGRVSINGDTDHIIMRPSKVTIGHSGYVAGRNINIPHYELSKAFVALNGDTAYEFEDIDRLTTEWNIENGYADANGDTIEFIDTDKNGKELDTPIDIRLKLKNVITGWFAPTAVDVRRYGWYVRDGLVFLNEETADSYEALVNADASADSTYEGY